MVLGFNHNLTYKGEVFHVQTEDSGVNNPHIITLLYRGGLILCSKKTSYADILMMDNLESVVEELMKAQHKDLMRRLKSGEFDDRAFSTQPPLLENYEIPSPKPEAEAAPVPEPRRIDDIFSSPAVSPPSSSQSDLSLLFALPAQKAAVPAAPTPAEKPAKEVVSLDEAILNFFGTNAK
ncbi:MAG: hypothetical protein H7X83_05200 [Verrucomicrobia bacterium]|nr:hypothetical protein [Deltaproteobacteria bacterium]